MTIFAKWAAAMVVTAVCHGAYAVQGVESLRTFVAEVHTGQAVFTQTVTSSDGLKKKVSSGFFEFSRPHRFRFVYNKPFDYVIVSDGDKVWIYDPALQQVSTQSFSQALGATPAALLSGDSLEKDFSLRSLPSQEGLTWAQATPKLADSSVQSVRLGFRGRALEALDIMDSFGQRSELRFSKWTPSVVWPAEHFRFLIPPGVDLLEQ